MFLMLGTPLGLKEEEIGPVGIKLWSAGAGKIVRLGADILAESPTSLQRIMR